MKYLLLVHHNEDRFNQIPQATRKDMRAESIQLRHQLHSSEQYIHASPLQPEARGTVVRVRNGKPMVTDGPFMETKEQIAGYFLVDAENQAQAIEVATQVPGARIGTVEVRSVVETSGLPHE